jgi:hypothetical protein
MRKLSESFSLRGAISASAHDPSYSDNEKRCTKSDVGA